MAAHLRELSDLLLRWVHLIAGIMWIGNSLLFNWLDRNLERPAGAPERSMGRIWLLHSGGFYDVEKTALEPGQLPERLHWFKWQNFATWASGIGLLVVVYYAGGGALLVDPSVRALSTGAAIGIGVASIVGGFLIYDLLCRLFLSRPVLLAILGGGLLVGLAAALGAFLSGRAAYLHVGVVIGTIMTGNVWFVILPSQKELVAATKEGRAQDPAIGLRAKQRSVHNNYMTFPLLFVMISNHFPSTYGHPRAWLVLAVISASGGLARHILNVRFDFAGWKPALGATIVGTVVVLAVMTRPKPPPIANAAAAPPSFAEVRAIVERRCATCHADAPTDDVWKIAPVGVKLDTPERIRAMAPRIRERAFVLRTMPLANKTEMTDGERAALAAWVEAGANP